MSLESIACNRCGSMLEVASGVRFVTCRSCGTALTVQRTDTSSWTEAAGAEGERLDRLEENVQHLNIRSELEVLDSQWEREREEYMTSNKYGVKSLPNKTGSTVGGVVVVVFGLLWTIFAFSITSGSRAAFADAPPGFGPPAMIETIFPLFGLLFIAFGVGVSIWGYKMAEKYEKAKAVYEQKRKAIEAKMRR